MDMTETMSKHLCPFRTLFSGLTVGLITIALLIQPSFAEESEMDETEGEIITPEGQIKKDLALFWGKKREVKVVQRRTYLKDSKIDVTLNGGIIPNDDFLVYYLTGVNVGYHFAESFAVEGSFNMAFDQLSGLSDYLRNESDIGLKNAQIREFIKYFYNVSVLWSPIYGKVSILGQKLAHFGIYTGLGLGMMHTEGYESPENPDSQPQTKPAANAIIGFRWHLTDMFSLRTEYRHYFFEKIAASELSTPIALNLGLTATF
jgi:outer membrane beta-barrel protein